MPDASQSTTTARNGTSDDRRGDRTHASLEERIEWTRFRRATDKAVLKAIARWFAWRPDGTNVRFMVATLARKAGVPQRSTERALERLEADGWMEITARRRGSRRPTTYRLVVERLASANPDALRPVDATTAKVADEGARQPPEWRMWEPHNRQSGGCDNRHFEESRPENEKVADLSTEEEEVRTDLRTPASDRTLVRHNGGRREHPDVPRFLEWARVTYPHHANGAHLVIDRDRDGHLVHGLLEQYGRATLEAMAVQCWTLESDGDPTSHATWIAKSDRSLRVLKHKAAFLERVVTGAQQLTFGPMVKLSEREIAEAKDIRHRVYGGCPHQPRHDDWRDCVREIALARHIS